MQTGEGGRQLGREIREYLQERCPLTTEVAVAWADYHWVSVYARLVTRLQSGLAPFELEAARNQIRAAAQARLYRRIHPSVGGPSGSGWPLGRSITQGDIYPLLEDIPGVRHVADVALRSVRFEDGQRHLGSNESVLRLEESEVFCSDIHLIELADE